ncbi:MAG: L-erythro-3,5-diaminohexanoate dehydrogenase [Candidatus Muiribacteriota bacterium]
MREGNPYGIHRVLKPAGVLPQPAEKINNEMSLLYSNEILVDVDILNIDSASFTQIKNEAENDKNRIAEIINRIVNKKGKMQNPVTGSGGMFIGRVKEVGSDLKNKRNLKKGDKIASLVSLSLTPLKIDKIHEVKVENDQVKITGQAVLFESGIYARLPEDIPPSLALAVLDVCGAPAQTARFVKLNDTVVIIGAGGKSGILCAWEAKKRVGPNGKVIGIEYSDEGIKRLEELNICDVILKLNAKDSLSCYKKIEDITEGDMADLVINSVNITNTEMASIMMAKNKGIVYFFSMATSFTKAALGAEGVGKDVDMIVGNGYTMGHADLTLEILRESPEIKELYSKLY